MASIAPAAAANPDTLTKGPVVLARKTPPSRQIYEAVTRGDLGQGIRELPKHIQAGFKGKLEGIMLPEKEKHRTRFLNELSALTARLLENGRNDTEYMIGLVARKGYRAGMVREELDNLERIFDLVGDVAGMCMRLSLATGRESSLPSDYVRFISRPGVDIERLLTTMQFFAGERRIRIRNLSMEQRKAALEMEMMAKRSDYGSIRGLLSEIVQRLPKNGLDGKETSPDWRIARGIEIAALMVRKKTQLGDVVRKDCEKLIRDKKDERYSVENLTASIGKAVDDPAIERTAHEFLIGCGIYLTDTGKMLRFGKMFKEGPIEGYVVLKPESLRRYGYEGLTTGDIRDTTVLLASEKEHTIQHEIQHVFDKITYVESVLSGEDNAAEQTKQNLLGMEIRARLAEMAFSHDNSLILDSMQEVRDIVCVGKKPKGYDFGIRYDADKFVHERIGRFKKPSAIKRAARKLLDQAYRQAYGLTYSQIIEPFRADEDIEKTSG